MSEVVHAAAAAPAVRRSHGVSWRTQRAVRSASERALRHQAEVLAMEFVADVAVGATARVTGEEIFCSTQYPDYAYRFRRIGDIQAHHAARKVAEMGQ